MVVLPKDLLQFQIIVNPHTGRRIGRIYFPYLYISRHKEAVKSWLEQKKIYFTPEDVKLYRDGSFRLYFEAPLFEYELLHKTLHP
jgi:hypothetical protein